MIEKDVKEKSSVLKDVTEKDKIQLYVITHSSLKRHFFLKTEVRTILNLTL